MSIENYLKIEVGKPYLFEAFRFPIIKLYL